MTFALPAASSYAADTDRDLVLRADDFGSILDLSSLTTFSGQSGSGQLDIQAVSGGRVNLGHVVSNITGLAHFLSDGTNSTIDISALTSFGGIGSLQASNGGALFMDQLTTLGSVDLYVGGSMATSQITEMGYTDFELTIDGVVADFSSLTGALDGKDFTVTNGGSINMPNVTDVNFWYQLSVTSGGRVVVRPRIRTSA